ncbi:MAG: helix-turn-helix domain-containing protein [Lachnospiraceae bacterium]|nr:helix-turn-helix domain-containing protein [Lachnospiraceae bacterium]
MRETYTTIPERLFEYRERLNKTQEEMGESMGISSSQYCKLENGQHNISYESLKTFEKNGYDVFYLLTGEHYKKGILDIYVEKCKNTEECARMLTLLIWVTEQGILKISKDIPENIIHMWKYVTLTVNKYRTQNIWLNIREVERLSQVRMAQLIDIDVKRYRRIEKMQTLPDAEILATLYEKLSYSPLLFLKNQLYYPDLINRIWEQFPIELKTRLEHMLKEGHDLIQCKGVE